MSQIIKWPRFYMYGASLTQFGFGKSGCWASIIADEFQRQCDVITRGFSGYNSRQCRALLPFLRQDMEGASVAGIFLGANDANDPAINPQQAVPLQEYKENLKYIVNFMKNECGIKRVFLVTPPALDAKKWKAICDAESKPCGNSEDRVPVFVAGCEEVAKELSLPCLNIHQRMMERNDWKDMLEDGLHFATKGGEFLASLMIPIVKQLLQDSGDSPFGGHFLPLWKEVSNERPENSFSDWFNKNSK